MNKRIGQIYLKNILKKYCPIAKNNNWEFNRTVQKRLGYIIIFYEVAHCAVDESKIANSIRSKGIHCHNGIVVK